MTASAPRNFMRVVICMALIASVGEVAFSKAKSQQTRRCFSPLLRSDASKYRQVNRMSGHPGASR